MSLTAAMYAWAKSTENVHLSLSLVHRNLDTNDFAAHESTAAATHANPTLMMNWITVSVGWELDGHSLCDARYQRSAGSNDTMMSLT